MKEYLFDLGMKRVIRELDELLNLDPENLQLKFARSTVLLARPEADAAFKQPTTTRTAEMDRDLFRDAYREGLETIIGLINQLGEASNVVDLLYKKLEANKQTPIEPPKGAKLGSAGKDSENLAQSIANAYYSRPRHEPIPRAIDQARPGAVMAIEDPLQLPGLFSDRNLGEAPIDLGLSSRTPGIAPALSEGDPGDEQPVYNQPVLSTHGIQNSEDVNLSELEVPAEVIDEIATRLAYRYCQSLIDKGEPKVPECDALTGAHGGLDFTGGWILNNGLLATVQERRKDGGWEGIVHQDVGNPFTMLWDEYGKDPELETNGDYDLKDRIRAGARYNHHN